MKTYECKYEHTDAKQIHKHMYMYMYAHTFYVLTSKSMQTHINIKAINHININTYEQTYTQLKRKQTHTSMK